MGELKNKNNTCYVTTPIYYASGNVHIGNSYSTIVCDCFSRYNRLKGVDTFFLTGMDEHGQKIEEAAAKEGKTPQEHVDKIALQTSNLWKELKVTNDDFIRTSEERHVKVVQDIFEKMIANDDIYLGSYEGDYCVSCESFFTKTQIAEGNTCPDCGKPLRKVQEECYFLKLKKYSDRLLNYIKENPDFIQPESRKNEVVSFIESGLEDLAVSRTSYKWGIPVKSNPRHVIYVWIDALCNYITALGYGSSNEELFNKFWVNGGNVCHVVGKDILRFHAVYWPIMLMALDIPINFKLYVHGWYLFKDGKMSKSKGNVIYPREVCERYGLDAMRLYLIKEMDLGNDGLFTYEKFVEKYNSYLSNDLGNLVSRTIAMINKYFGGKVEKPAQDYTPYDSELVNVLNETVKGYTYNFDNFRFQNGLNAVWTLISRCNKYIDETMPWALAKDESRREELNSVLYHLYEALRVVSIMLLPVMPDSAALVLDELTVSQELREFNTLAYGLTESATVVNEAVKLFARLDVKKELEFHSQKEVKVVPPLKTKEEISIDDFGKLDLRVGKVLEASKLEGSDKLLVLKVKIEDSVRQIVSGISNHYSPESMVGKKVVVVANLKPAKIRGVESYGMILACESKKGLEVLEVHSLDEYSKVR